MEVSGAVVVITGASSGIGAAAARAFAAAGASVVLVARRAELLEAVAAGMSSALVLPTDLAQPGAARAVIEATLSRFGRIDVLINNAAMISVARCDAIGAADLRAALRANFLAPVEAVHAALPTMRKQGRGHIINVGSPGAFLAMPLMGAYAGSKGALSGWTRTMQAEWVGSGIMVTEYLPGRVDTGARVQSELGEIGADTFDDAGESGWMKLLLRRQPPEQAAAQLLACVRRPRAVVYSSFSARLAALLAASPGLSQRLGARLARLVRGRLGISPFTPLPVGAPPVGRVAAAAAAPNPKAASPAREASPSGGEMASPPIAAAAPEPAVEVPPPAPEGEAPPPEPEVGKEPARVVARRAAGKPVAKQPAAKKPAAKKQPARKAPVKKSTAKPPRPARAADEDDAARAVTPFMSERVRAAAEKAAAAAKRRGSGGGNRGES